jgi:site-specific recombinase XerD
MPPSPPTSPLSKAVQRYLMFLQSEENKSPLTVKSYRESLNMFITLCNISSPEKINKHAIALYKQALHEFRTKKTGLELTIRTKNHHLTVLRAFLRYLIQEEELNTYPPDRVKRFKEDPRKVKVLFKEDLERLLAAPDTSKRAGMRDSAILELFFSTGLRLAELCSLNTKDVNFTTREMSVRGKRGRIRLVFISPRAGSALKEYIESRVDSLTPLFISKPDTAHEASLRSGHRACHPKSQRSATKNSNKLSEATAGTLRCAQDGEEFRLSSNMVYRLVKSMR